MKDKNYDSGDLFCAEEGRSVFFGVKDNAAAAFSAFICVVISFIPFFSWFSWAIPLFMAVFERKSFLSRVCAFQSFAFSAIMSLAALGVNLLGMFFNAESVSPSVAFIGALFSIIQIVCMVMLVYTGAEGWKRRIVDIPVLTRLVISLVKK